VVICLERGADLHMAQLMPLASVKFRLVFPFWYWLTRVVPDKGPLNRCVCVCLCVCPYVSTHAFSALTLLIEWQKGHLAC